MKAVGAPLTFREGLESHDRNDQGSRLHRTDDGEFMAYTVWQRWEAAGKHFTVQQVHRTVQRVARVRTMGTRANMRVRVRFVPGQALVCDVLRAEAWSGLQGRSRMPK